uniref:ATP-dependent Clp protease proteolytic subunit n=1 Tax=Centranthera grandiflora TaxID=2491184 RepID=A0A8A2XXH4_9LAMI|nr:proteolytic subunit of the ATP-dependent Clp protease [Centranthera grandiflora]QSX28417.1 proteolytic subunit of the ATP-dependent Clp protease [Centranthera grandiflora]
MPIGVPKVVFRIPGDEDASWVDLYNRLYRERILFLFDEVETELSNQIMGLIIFLSIEDGTKDVYLLINSPGGSVICGIGIFDTMHFVPAEVITLCMGFAASMASFILVGGVITRRVAYPSARVMIHQPASSFFEAQAGEMILEGEEMLNLREKITNVYVQRTGKPFEVISEDMERDFYMSATEAKTYGIIDLVGIE